MHDRLPLKRVGAGMMRVGVLMAAVTVSALAVVGEDFPVLHGDGVHDDAEAIQARLDSGVGCVYLPPPAKAYLVGRTLKLPSNCELRLDRFTRVRQAPGMNAFLLVNADRAKGNVNIAVTGGTWDFDNLRQAPNPDAYLRLHPGTPEKDRPWPKGYCGVGIQFVNVTGLSVRGVTLVNPVTYAMQLCDVGDFTVDDVRFDFTTANPAKANMDGLHLDGGCHHGRITNLRGTCFDDLLAINASDGDGSFGVHEGPIHDVTVDGIYADYCHSAVRILSTSPEHFVRGVTIRNIHGNFYRYTVGLTHFFANRKTCGVFDDITIADCHVGKALQPTDLQWKLYPHPVILVDERCDVGSLNLVRFTREEKTDPEMPTIDIRKTAKIERLAIRDCEQINRTGKPLVFLRNLGEVKTLVEENTRIKEF